MRLTRAEINLRSLHFNLEGIRKKVGPHVRLMGIVKANAYGHGIIEVAHALNKFGIDYLGVGFLEEGILLRNHGITTPILVLGGVLGSQVEDFLEYNLDITVSSIEIAERINAEVRTNGGRKPRIHLKIDTGMERLGVRWEHAPKFLERVKQLSNLQLIGIYSHFATADEKDKSFAYEQLQRFQKILKYAEDLGMEIPCKHIANSGAILDIPESYFSMVRPGILLYGIYPSLETSECVSLRTVLELKSKVVYIKEVLEGMTVSYGRQYLVPQKTKIATVPIGYGDGYNRLLSNAARVVIGGKKYPVVGAVCMDQIMVDIGLDTNMHVGDDVTLIGRESDETVTAWDLALMMKTVPYEVLTNIASRVPRFYLDE
jgi:alanine racemase